MLKTKDQIKMTTKALNTLDWLVKNDPESKMINQLSYPQMALLDSNHWSFYQETIKEHLSKYLKFLLLSFLSFLLVCFLNSFFIFASSSEKFKELSVLFTFLQIGTVALGSYTMCYFFFKAKDTMFYCKRMTKMVVRVFENLNIEMKESDQKQETSIIRFL